MPVFRTTRFQCSISLRMAAGTSSRSPEAGSRPMAANCSDRVGMHVSRNLGQTGSGYGVNLKVRPSNSNELERAAHFGAILSASHTP